MHRYTMYENNIRATRNYTPEKKITLTRKCSFFLSIWLILRGRREMCYYFTAVEITTSEDEGEPVRATVTWQEK